MNQLLIYTAQTSNRLAYTLNLLIADLLGLEYKLTTDKDFFASHSGPKFSYAPAPVADEIFFESALLLFEKDIKHQPIALGNFENIQGFYPATTERPAISFDVFASAFFMISRYKEYIPGKLDKYGRYRASQSLAYRVGFLEKPMINYYALALKKILSERYPQLVFKKHRFKYTVSVDVDMAYSYLYKGIQRNLGGVIRSFIFSDFNDIRERMQVLASRKRDPFDTFDYIERICGENEIPYEFFFLLSDGSRFDKNIDPSHPKLRSLIERLSASAPVGIHLSYRSHVNNNIMQKEIKRLAQITGKEVKSNRFHYLRFTIPETYLRLIKLGITEDHSMGYAPHIGFRAGICTPFYFFNVKADEVTNLKIFPFAFMDTTFTHYYRNDTNEALEKIQNIMKQVKEVGGDFTGLWHNSSLTDKAEWAGWRNIFETVAYQASVLMKEE